jgi:hypothetical protein
VAKISLLPRLAAPIGTELVPVVTEAGATMGAEIGDLAMAAVQPAVARATAAGDAATSALGRMVAGAGGMLDLRYIAPNAWPDPDNTGLAGFATNALAPSRPATSNSAGRPTIVVPGRRAYFRVVLDDAGIPIGQNFVFGFTALEITAAAGTGVTIFAQILDANSQVIEGTAATFITGGPPSVLPARMSHVWQRTPAMQSIEGYFFFEENAANRGVFTDFLLATGSEDSFRPVATGREVMLSDYLAQQGGLGDWWSHPNCVPDQAGTGLAVHGWSADVPVIRSNGRNIYAIEATTARIRGSIAGVGAAGAPFCASAVLRLAGSAQAVAAIVAQTRANGTTIDGTARGLALTSGTWSRERLCVVGDMIVHPEAVGFELVFDAGGGRIEASLLSVHGGTNPSWRPGLPTPAKLRELIGLTDSDPNSVTAHYWVDARPGPTMASDVNAGTRDAPFRTLTAALAAVGAAPDKTIAILRGSVLRNQSINSAAPGLSIIAVGDGPAPKSLGSDAYSKALLTDAGNGVFTLALGYKPSTCAFVEIGTGRVFKPENPDSNDTPPALGNWGWAGTTFYVNPGFDITGWVLEIPRNDGTGAGYDSGAPRQSITGIEFEHWRDHGASSTHADTRWLGVWCNWCGFDGFDQAAGATRFLIRGGGAIGNGRRYGSDLGPGDGSSGHDGCDGLIEGAIFKLNRQTGVGNLYDTRIEVRYCLFEDNLVGLQVYAHGGGSAVDHTPDHWWHHNVISLRSAKAAGAFAVKATSQPAGRVRIHNLTIYAAPSSPRFAVATIEGMAVDLANCVVDAANTTFAFANYAAADGSQGKVSSRNNVVRVAGRAWQDSYDASRGGGIETGLLTADPQLVDPELGDFRLRPTSPAIGTALDLAYTRDYAGAALASPLDRGALRAA